MRVVDLRSAPASAPPTIASRASSAAELLRALGVLFDPEPHDYDVGADRILALRQRLPDALRTDVEHLGGGDYKTFLVLSHLAAALDEPAGVDELLAALRADPALPWQLLVAHRAEHWDAVEDRTVERLASGDEEAIAQLRDLAAAGDAPPPLAALLDRDPGWLGPALTDVVERFRAAVWDDLEVEAMDPVRRDAAHRREQIDQGMDVGAVVMEASNGYELPDDPTVRHVLLLPSYWLRPWIVHGRVGTTAVISTPVADQFLALPSEAPPPALLKLFKALSDEGRLKLLRRMTAGPISLGDAVAELDVAKATAHHHLSVLRQAGLVLCRGERRTTRYALREDPPAAARDALAAYVHPHADSPRPGR